jgi:hypothetical protein
VVTFAAAEGTHVETVVFMEGGTLEDSIGTLDVPVDAKNVVVGGGETETRIAFRPYELSVHKFCGSGGFEMKEYGVPPLCADEADVTNHPHDLQLSFLTYANNPSPLQITLRRPYPQVSKAKHNNPGTTKAPIVPRLAKTPSPCLDIAYSQ